MIFGIFLTIAVIFGLFYSFLGNDIFDLFNVDKGYNEKRRKVMKKMPLPYKLERYFHRFIGVFIGWMLLWYLLDKRFNVFAGFNNTTPTIVDLILVIFAFVGINGRLPSIAHGIDKWFKLPSG